MLAADAQGRPGSVLERFDAVLPPLMLREPNAHDTATLTLTSQARPRLQAGSKYWLYVEPADPTTFTVWWPTRLPNTEDFLEATQPGRWQYQPPGPQRPDVAGRGSYKEFQKGAFAVTVTKPTRASTTSTHPDSPAGPSGAPD